MLLLALSSCGNKQSSSKMEEAVSVSPVVLEEPSESSKFVNRNDVSHEAGAEDKIELNKVDEKSSAIKIIKTGQISIESKQIKNSKKNIDANLKKFNAYYEQESSSNSNDLLSYTLEVRIPSQSFDSFLAAMENGEDKITAKNIQADDVSLQYYDIESRMKSKKAYLDRYLAMVSSAKNVKDLLEIQEKIRELQEEIDSSEEVLRKLSNKISYSTLTIQLFEYQANLPIGSQSFWAKMKSSFEFGGDLIQNIVLGIIGIWPVWILVGLVIFLIRKIRKRRRAVKS